MRIHRTMITATGLSLLLVACVSIPEGGILGTDGEPFVMKGTATISQGTPGNVFGGGTSPQLVWIGTNGITYHLFQAPLLDNDLFDRVTTPGVTSRLLLVVRSDLEVAEPIGTIVEVQEVMEVVE